MPILGAARLVPSLQIKMTTQAGRIFYLLAKDGSVHASNGSSPASSPTAHEIARLSTNAGIHAA